MKRFCILLLTLCTIGMAQAQVGIMRSGSYGAIKKEKVKRPQKPLPNAMIGISAGGGVTASKHVIYPNGALGFDFAISVTPKFAMGMFTQWGILENLSLGLQLVGGDFANHKAAFIGGVGIAMNARGSKYYNYDAITIDNRNYDHYTTETFTRNGVPCIRTIVFEDHPINGVALRLGVNTPKHFYVLFDLGVFPGMYVGIIDSYHPEGMPWYGASTSGETAVTATISFGYAFNIISKRDKQLKEEGAL